MTIIFERPVGAHLDVKELEYIAALHQSGTKIRPDASVTSGDVINFLLSRHGIKADKHLVEKRLMPGLAGAMGDNPSAVFDIVELVSILIIPHLKKVADSSDDTDIQLLFGNVLKMVFSDVYGDANRPSPVLTRDTMALVLETYGEVDVSPQIIDEMLAAAGVKDEDTKLDVDALIKATTGDVSQFNNDWAKSASTHYDDVFHGTILDMSDESSKSLSFRSLRKDDTNKSEAIENLEDGEEEHLQNSLQRVLTISVVDYVAENYSSKAFVVVLWVLTIMVYFVYFLQLQTSLIDDVDCDRFQNEFGCRIANAVLGWLLIFVQLSAFGGSFLILASAGSSSYSRSGILSVVLVLLGITAITFASILTYIVEGNYFFFELNKSNDIFPQAGYICCIVVGCITILFYIKKLVFILTPESVMGKIKGSGSWRVPGMAKAELATKEAAEYKIKELIGNCMRLHDTGAGIGRTARGGSMRASSTSGTFGIALLNFQASVDERERVGGIFWAIKKMWDGSIFHKEGVWIHARLIASNLSQIFVALVYFFLLLSLGLGTANDWQTNSSGDDTSTESNPFNVTDPAVAAALVWAPEALGFLASQSQNFSDIFWNVNPELSAALTARIMRSLPEPVLAAVVNNTSVEAVTAFCDIAQLLIPAATGSLQRHLQEEESSSDTTYEVKLWQVIFSLAMGGTAAVVATTAIAVVFLPSAISTIMKFRSGVIGTLRDRSFQLYRVAPDQTTILFGSAFWGIIFASGVLFGITAIVVFLFVWTGTRSVVLIVFAQVCGIAVTLITKVLVLLVLRRFIFSGFFRKQPLSANIMLVLFECWSLALTFGTMLARLVKFLLIAGFYIARIDTPMLAPGVGAIGPVQLDTYPIQFRKDLLVHDAHRHPYMERLGVIYMLKLRYGDAFATRAGSAWRLILVLALMPWMRRYRLDEDEKEETFEKALLDDEEDEEEEERHDEEDNIFKMKEEIIRLRKRVKELEQGEKEEEEHKENTENLVEVA